MTTTNVLTGLLPYEPAHTEQWPWGTPKPEGSFELEQFKERELYAQWAWFPQPLVSARDDLADWIVGNDARRTRGSVLITGLRGVGKTTFVNGTIHAASSRLFEQSSSAECKKALLPVRINCPRRITAEALLRRVIRRTYLELVDKGIGEVLPDIVRQARGAYLRTLGTTNVNVTEKLRESLGVSTSIAGDISLSAEKELSLSRAIELTAEQLDSEQCEDEVSRLAQYVFHSASSSKPSLMGRMAETFTGRVTAVKKNLLGQKAPDLRLVFVFDELDKIENMDDVKLILSTLKTLFTACPASFVFVAGVEMERAWLAAEIEPDNILSSIFAFRAYVPTLQGKNELRATVEGMLKRALPDDLPQDAVLDRLLHRSGGVRKTVTRLLRSEFELGEDNRLTPRERFKEAYQGEPPVVPQRENASAYEQDARRLVAAITTFGGRLGVEAAVAESRANERLGLLPLPPPEPEDVMPDHAGGRQTK